MASRRALRKVLEQPRSYGEARLFLLRQAGMSLSAIARELGRDVSLISRVVAGKRRARPTERALAKKLGMRLSELFPEWYGRVA